MAAGRWEDARKSLLQVQEMEAGYRDMAPLLSKVEAEIEREKAERRRAEQIASLYKEVQELSHARKWQQALARMDEIYTLEPHFDDPQGIATRAQEELERQGKLDVLYTQAQAALKAGDWPEAQPALEALLAEQSDYKDAAVLLEWVKKQQELSDLYAQAQHLHRAGQWQAVVNVFAQIAALAPEFADPEELLPSAEQEIAAQKRRAELEDLYRRAGQAVDARQWEKARDLLLQIQAMEGGYRETEQLLALAEAEIAEEERQAELNALYEQAQAARKAGDWSGAVSTLEKLVAQAPDFYGAADMLDELKKAMPTPGEMRLFGGVEMVYVPTGKFWMGSNDSDMAADRGEKPQHEVLLRGFWIDRTPVTNKEYWRFVEATGHKKPKHWKRGRIPRGREDHPVVEVSWHDAQAYCRWRSEQAGVAIRLPTEAEWEKAARGTDGRRYPWGDEFSQDKCNSRERGPGDTTPVERYSPQGDSPYGCADMVGNVLEWTSSLYNPYPYDAGDGRENPDESGSRVLRGGAWYFSRLGARCAHRDSKLPGSHWDSGGFRVVVAPALPS